VTFDGKTVLVTGARGGIGAGYVRAFTTHGATVVALDLPEFDVTSEQDWQRVVAAAGRVDVLVNNAAVYGDIGRKRPLTELTVRDWDRVLTVNVRGTWQGIKAVVSALADGGSIVNVSSVAGRIGAPGFAHYVASKSAVEGLTRAAARELGPFGIRVNAVAPGLVSTDATRTLNTAEYIAQAARGRSLQREMTPHDLVGAVMWLASSASAFVTGQTLIVDGGDVFT
jgi:NAD(P)-dependent dehydrogenase (short-subunit alcohol dehydrogenase family)